MQEGWRPRQPPQGGWQLQVPDWTMLYRRPRRVLLIPACHGEPHHWSIKSYDGRAGKLRDPHCAQTVLCCAKDPKEGPQGV